MPKLRIVDPDLWDHVNSRFEASPGHAAAARRGRGPRYPLSGLLRCTCGANYVFAGRDSYRCGRFHSNHTILQDCSNGSRFARRAIEGTVMTVFEPLLLTRDAIRYITSRAQELIREQQRTAKKMLKATPVEVAKLEAELEELRALLKTGKVRPELLQPALLAAEQRRKALRRESEFVQEPLARHVAVAIPRAAERVRNIVRRLRGTTNAAHACQIRDTLRRLIPGGTIVLAWDRLADRFTGTLQLDAARYTLEIPSASSRSNSLTRIVR